MMTFEAWNKITTARIPQAALKVLAQFRHRSDITVSLDEEGHAWVQWPQTAISEEILSILRPLSDVSFYYREGGTWFTLSSRFPAKITPPTHPGQDLEKLLFPTKMVPQSPENMAVERITPELTRGGPSRQASAIQLPLAALLDWVKHATTAQIHDLHGVYEADQAWLLGKHLPATSAGLRYYGEHLLLPLGYQLQPMLSVESYLSLVNSNEREVVFWSQAEMRILPRDEFAPLTRAGVRQVCRTMGATS